ncbi:MAG: hypothetical protein M0T79_11110, partial [Actinomycetota bacterium]|nr:hypothetical protein [Actinomycetota bacterium]
ARGPGEARRLRQIEEAALDRPAGDGADRLGSGRRARDKTPTGNPAADRAAAEVAPAPTGNPAADNAAAELAAALDSATAASSHDR